MQENLFTSCVHADICVAKLELNIIVMTYISIDRIVTKYRDDPWRMQLISKHFYSEEVFDDSTADRPKIRWRYRNFFSDNVVHGQRTNESDSPGNSERNSHKSYGDSHKDSHSDFHNQEHTDYHNDTDSKRTNFESKQVPVSILSERLGSAFCASHVLRLHFIFFFATTPMNSAFRQVNSATCMNNNFFIIFNFQQNKLYPNGPLVFFFFFFFIFIELLHFQWIFS